MEAAPQGQARSGAGVLGCCGRLAAL